MRTQLHNDILIILSISLAFSSSWLPGLVTHDCSRKSQAFTLRMLLFCVMKGTINPGNIRYNPDKVATKIEAEFLLFCFIFITLPLNSALKILALGAFPPSTWRKGQKIWILGIFNKRQLVSAYFFLEMLHTLGTDFVKITDCIYAISLETGNERLRKIPDNLLSKKLLDSLLL